MLSGQYVSALWGIRTVPAGGGHRAHGAGHSGRDRTLTWLMPASVRDRKLHFYFGFSLSHNLNERGKENETNAVSGQSDHS